MSRRTQGDRDHRQRLLDRFIKTGLAGFADYEILELILMLAIPQGDVIEPARELIAKYKDLRGILDAPIEELRAISGIASAMPGRSPNGMSRRCICANAPRSGLVCWTRKAS